LASNLSTKERDSGITFEDEQVVKNKILGNMILREYRYEIDDRDLEIRFQEFWKWLNERTVPRKTIPNTKELFRELLYLEAEIASDENRRKVQEFQKSITFEARLGSRYNRPWLNEKLTDDIIKEFIELRGFKDIEEITKLDEGDKELIELRTKIEKLVKEVKEGLFKANIIIDESDIRRLVRLDMALKVITKTGFIEKYWEISRLSDKKLVEELELWLQEEEYHPSDDDNENTDEDEESNESDDKSIDTEIDGRRIVIHKFEVERLKRLGFNKYYLGSLGFIQKYKENEGKTDEELVGILKEWKKPVEYSDSDSQEDDEEIFIVEDEITERILEELEKLNIKTNKSEITRLQELGFNEVDILKEEFFKRFQRIKDELDSVVKNELKKWLFEEKVQELLKEKEDKLAKASEYEIRELLRLGYSKEEILEDEIIMKYRELDRELDADENEEKVKEKLDEYIEIRKNEYAELEKLAKEVMGRNIEENDKRKDENPKENIEDQNVEKLFEDEEKDEDKSEKLINTDGIYSKQDSD
jgi:hypothetical protein